MLYPDFSELVQSIFVLSLSVLIFIFFVVLAVLNLKALKKYYKTGLFVGIIVFLMTLPAAIFNLIYFDPSVILKGRPEPFLKIYIYIGLIVGLGILILKIGWHMIVYYAAVSEWDKIRPEAFTVLKKSKNVPWKVILAAAIFGVVSGVVSTVIFVALGMNESEPLKRITLMFPHAAEAGLIIRIPVLLLFVTGAAVIEELVFRGGLQAFLLRLSGNKRPAVIGSIIFVSLLWAGLHIFNTDMPAIKSLQIFIIGIVFSEFTRRSCVESAMAGHIALNFTAVIMYFIMI
ncbi:MAG: CPBP family glutamic-type intramembrane protease [Planctomycetota bacterium]